MTKYNTEKSLFRNTEMEYLGFWETHDSAEPIDKNTSNKKYEATDFSKMSTSVYRCSELLPQYVVKRITYVSAFN